MNEEPRRIYEFGAFRLDPRARLLLRDGQPVALTPKVFDTLLLMVQHHGQLLEKEQLMQALWAHSFVEESNLTYNISTLRKALGEKAARQPFIVTVPGHGYRFVAEVREVTLKGSVEAKLSVLQLVHSKLKRRVFLTVGLLLLFTILLFFLFAYQSRANSSSATAPGKSIAVLPLKLLDRSTADVERGYLSDGLSESLINHLCQQLGVKVIADSCRAPTIC